MKKRKVFVSLLAFLTLAIGVVLMSNNSYTKASAEEPTNSSEVVSSSEPTPSVDDLEQEIKDEIDKYLSQFEWYQDNKGLIWTIVGGISAFVGTSFAVLIFIGKITSSAKALKDSADNLSSKKKDTENEIAKLEEAQKIIEEQGKQIEALTNEIKLSRESMSNMANAISIAYCNDPNMVKDGRASSINRILSENKVVVANGEKAND